MAPQALPRNHGAPAQLTGRTGIDRRDVALAAACAALALWSYRWALGSYFSPDDLILLERARGLAPSPEGFWRVLSGRLWFGSVVPVFGSHAIAYFITHWVLHAINTVLVYAFVRRAGGGMGAAIIAAAPFASSRLFLSVVGQAVGIGDLLALTFTLVAGLSLTRDAKLHRWIAPVSFSVALLAKESVIALPAAFVLLPAVGRDLRERITRLAPLFAASAAWAFYLIASESSTRAFGGPAYQTGFGMQIPRSLGTYAGWIVDFVNPAPDFSRPAEDRVLIACVIALAIVLGISFLARTRATLTRFGIAWFVLGLGPVLPLMNQHNLHYLYAPFVGVAIAVGSAFAAVAYPIERRGAVRRAVVWGTAAALLVAHAAVSDHLMRRRIQDELFDETVPYDPFVRKVEIIRRMSRRIAPLATQAGSRVVIVVPRIDDRLAELFRGLLPGVVDQGRGLRALYPNLDSVAFVDHWTPAYRDYQLVAGSVDGNVVGFGTGPDAHLQFARVLIENGFIDESLRHLSAVATAYPDDPRLQLAYGNLARARAQPMPQSSSRPSSPPMR